MKLYKVTAEFSFFMAAEDDTDAAIISTGYALECIKNEQIFDIVTETEVTSLKEVPHNWREGLPYGENENLNCAQILAAD